MSIKQLLLWLFITAQCALAQHPYESALNPIQDILPPAPTAAGLGVYGEIPVSLHTGIPSISIPLGVLQGRNLSVPLSLSYHGGGHQVDAVSSWVGLGWSLNAGGVITRTVHGLADDDAQFGYWTHPVPDDFLAQGVISSANQQQANEADAYYQYLKAAAEGKRDGQPDQFNFNINGYAGRFYIENTGDPSNPLVPRLVPHQDIKIELVMSNATLQGFALTTPDGTQYLFGGQDITGIECVEKSKNNTTYNCGRTYSVPVITSWYLRKIQSANGMDAVDFVYEPHTMNYEASISQTQSKTTTPGFSVAPPSCPNNIQSQTCISDLYVQGIHLKRIEALGGRVEFISNNQREDLSTGGVRLTEIRHYGAESSSNYLKKQVLSQDYFLSHTTTAPAGRHKRLRLLQVQEIGQNNTSTKPPYVLEYENTLLPPRLSKAKDFWGYYNGKNGNTSLIPASIPTNANFHQGGGDRYPDVRYGKAGTLQKITYPTGGHTLLEYESHERGYDTPLPELAVQNAGMSALYDQQSSTNTYTSTFNLTHPQTVNVTVNVTNKCGVPAQQVSYLKIEEAVGNGWQPLTIANSNIVPSSATSTGNDGPGTIDLGVHPTVEITQTQPYNKTFELTLPAGNYRLTAAALHGTTSSVCNYDDELSIFVRHEAETGNLIYNEAVGGVRIKRVTTHDGMDASKDMVKEYQYTKASNVSQSSGKSIRPVRFKSIQNTYSVELVDPLDIRQQPFICEQQVTTKFSESQLPLHGISGGHIAYREVTVLNDSQGSNGKTWNKFAVVENTAATVQEGLNAPLSLLDWRGGLLLEQISYKNENGNFVKVQESINDYEVASINGDSSLYTFYGTKVGKITDVYNTLNNVAIIACNALNTSSSSTPGTYANYLLNQHVETLKFLSFINLNFDTYLDLLGNDNIQYPPNSYIPHPCEGKQPGTYLINYAAFSGYSLVRYPIYSGWNKLTKTTNRQYKENGVDYVETSTEYDYDNVYTHLKSSKVTNSDGTAHISQTKYVTDYPVQSNPAPTDSRVLAIQQLQAQHQHATVIEQSQYIKKVGSTKEFVAGMFTTFEIDPNNPRAINPVSIHRSELAAPLPTNNTSFLSTAVDGNNNFYNMGFYTQYGRYTGQNDKGLPLGFVREGDVPNSFVWGYNDRAPIMKATNAHHSELGYTSLEAGETTSWNINATAATYPAGKIGKQALQSSQDFPLEKVFAVEGQSKKYTFSAWVKNTSNSPVHLVLRTCGQGSSANYPNVPSAYQQVSFSNTGNNWQLISVELDLGQIRADASLAANDLLAVHAYVWNPNQQTIVVDAARFHPSDAFVESYDYEENTLLPTTIESNNRLHSRYYYDNFQRLSHIKDFEDNIISSNEYYYKNGGNTPNYVASKAVRVAGKTSLADLNGLPTTALTESYQYLDGLGRAIQTIGKGQSPTGKDLIAFQEYDQLGRQPQTYLPFVHSSQNTGSFANNPIALQQSFYSSSIAPESQTAYAYGETVFEASPLNRPKEQSSAGEGWELGSNHTLRTSYSHNKGSEVLRLDVQSSNAIYYPANSLTKTTVINTKGIKSISYTDKLGRSILTQQEISPQNWTSTYIVYNAFGNVQAVITPLAVQTMQQSGNYNYTQTALKELIYTYQYDQRQRLITKKVPNTASVHYVYDQLDRVVASQDGNQAQAQQWMIQKYDVYGRQILTALYNSHLDQIALQQYFDQQSQVFETKANSTIGYSNTIPVLAATDAIQTIQYYDDYDFDNNGQADALFVPDASYPTPAFDRTIGQATGSKIRLLDSSNTFLLQVRYYDNRGRVLQTQSENHLAGKDISWSAYDFVGNLIQLKYQHSTIQNKKTIAVQTEEFFTYDHTGRLLTVQHQVGNDNKVLLAQHEYDELGRLVEKNLHSTNGGSSFLQSVDYHYNVKDWLVRINDLHPVSPASLDPDDGIVLLENRINTLLAAYQEEEEAPNIKVEASTVELANKIVYTAVVEQQPTEELEQSLKANLASHGMTNNTVTETLLQNLQEEYEAKWLLLPTEQEDNEDLFEMNLSYDYGGNINHQEWKVASYNYRSIYDYAYDNLDRLTQAEYREYLESSTPVLPLYQNQEAFSVPNIGYDVMGNITELERRGTVAVQGSTLTNGLLDKLTYSYQGNQLQAVQDAGQSSKGFVDGAASNQEYHYDVNGNVTKDDNKQIAIVYNHLNLPKQINFAQNNARIDWLYTATGQKVQKKVTAPNNTVTYKHYIGKVQYLGAEIEFIQHQEGRIVRKLTGVATNNEPIYAYSYEYCLKDHLGNSRVFFSDLDKDGIVEVSQGGSTNELLQQAHYYPFGLGIEGQWEYVQPQVGNGNAYLYNGKELNADFGLGWNDYEARWYDASIARWNGVDPLAEEYKTWSPYNYVANNPLKYIDPDGREIWIFYKQYKKNGKLRAKRGRVMYKDGKLYDRRGKEVSVDNNFVQETVASLDYVRENGDDKVSFLKSRGHETGLIDIMENLPQEIEIMQTTSLDGDQYVPAERSHDGKSKLIYHSRAGLEFVDAEGNTVKQSPSTGLFHEFIHAYRDILEGYSQRNENGLIDYAKMEAEENMVTVGPEAEYAKKKGEGVRSKHKISKFKYYKTQGPNTVEREKNEKDK